MPAIDLALRLALAAIFAGSAFAKFPRPRGFAVIVGAYELVPTALVLPVAVALPYLELALALLLASGDDAVLAVGLAVGVLTMLTSAVAINVVRLRPVPCGCFGTSGRRIGWPTLGEDAGITALGAAAGVIGLAHGSSLGWARALPGSSRSQFPSPFRLSFPLLSD